MPIRKAINLLVNTFRRTKTVLLWPDLILLKLWWPVLWVYWWSSDGIIISVDHQLLIGGFQGKGTGSSNPKGSLWVSLYGWHHCDLLPWIREAERVLGMCEWYPPKHYAHHGNRERWPPSLPWHSEFTREPVACWATRFTGNPLTQTASLTLAFATSFHHTHHPVLLSMQCLGACKHKL